MNKNHKVAFISKMFDKLIRNFKEKVYFRSKIMYVKFMYKNLVWNDRVDEWMEMLVEELQKEKLDLWNLKVIE